MAFQYEPYQSTYVDPQSVKIAEILRDRFIQNFNAADAVGTELSKLKAADFESDQKLKYQLDSDVRNKLNQYAEFGNYEDMTFKVSDTARDYRDRSTPITENYTRYVSYQQDLAKQYQKGKISSLAYRNAIPMTKALGYSGLEVDPNTGLVDPKSYFSGPSLVTDPKITEQLIKVLGQIEADSTDKTITGLYTDPQTGEMKYTSKSGWEGITEAKVQRAYEAVMSLPEVQQYLNQEAKYTAYEQYANPDGSLNADALNQVSTAGIEMHKAEMSKLAALIGSPKTSKTKKQQYQATLDAYQQSMNYLSGLKDPAQQLNYAATLSKEQLLAPYKDIAAGKVYNKTKSSYEEDYSEMEKDRRKAAATRQAELDKLTAEANAGVKFDTGAIDESILSSSLEVEKYKAESNIKNDLDIINDPNSGTLEIEEAKTRIANAYGENALISYLQGGNVTNNIDAAVDALVSNKSDMGDIDDWGFGTYGVPFDQLYNTYKSFKGGAGDKKDFYRILKEGPGSADYTGLATYVSQVHTGERGDIVLGDAKNALDAKLKTLGGNNVSRNRKLTTSTVPVGTDPIIAKKAADQIASQFKTLGDLSGFEGLIFRPGEEGEAALQTSGTLGGKGGILENWGEKGFKPQSQITGIRYGSANGMELTDKSQLGQYVILTVSPKEEGEGSVAGEVVRPYKEIYIPLEKTISQDMLTELNKPSVKLHRYIQTGGMGTEYKSPNQTYEFSKDFTDDERRAIQFSTELDRKTPAEAAKFLKENAATFEEYVNKGYLLNDGSFAGMPYQGLVIDVQNVLDPNKNEKGLSPKAEIFLIDINGKKMPMEKDGERAGYLDINGEMFRSIVNDQNVKLFDANGYILKTIK